MKYLTIAIISILVFTGCDISEDEVYNAFKCAEAATYLEDHTKANNAILTVGPHFKDDDNPNDPNFWMQLDERFKKEYKFDRYTASKQTAIMSTLYKSSECKKWYGAPDMPNKNPVTKLSTKNTTHSFEEIFNDFDTCDFPKVHYDIFSEVTTHPYFTEANIQPYKVAQGLAFYSVNESLYGMPVSEMILPVTWARFSVTFDLPIDRVRAKLSRAFGEGFELANISDSGYKPILTSSRDDPSKTVLYCDEPEYE